MSFIGLAVSVIATLLPGFSVAALASGGAPVETVAAEYPQASLVFTNGARGLLGVVYGTPPGFRPETLNLYLPPPSVPRPGNGFPLVMFIHAEEAGGDARHEGVLADLPEVLSRLAARGYVVAAIDYRPGRMARFPAQIEDVRVGLRWLRQNAARYGIDPTRTLTWGVSAGGNLAALAAVTCRAARAEVPPVGPLFRDDSAGCVKGAVAWGGIFDFGTIAAQAAALGLSGRAADESAGWNLLGCRGRACTGKINAASPVTYVSSFTPPMLLIAGDADTRVPYQQTRQMADRLGSAGVSREVYLLPGIGHDMLGESPEATQQAGAFALERTFSFIDATLGMPTQP